jgi:hypothetical protein
VLASRRVVNLTWYDNPPDAPAPGQYAAVDYVAAWGDGTVECGYVVWFRQGENPFRLVRQEQNFVERAAAKSADGLDQFNCPG